MRGIGLLLILLLLIKVSTAQTLKSQRIIAAKYNTNKLEQLKSTLQTANITDSIQVKKYIENTGAKAIIYKKKGFAQLRKISPSGIPLYYVTTNIDAANSTQTDLLWNANDKHSSLQGQDMIIGEWDGAGIRTTHQELQGRVTIGDGVEFNGDGASSRHPTHVAGTLIGSGVDNQARGMAPKAKLIGHDWNKDDLEMTTFAAKGHLLSNHSYGLDATKLPTWYFGYYSGNAATWDQISYNAPYYLIVSSAGNDRGYDPDIEGYINPSKEGYDLLTGASNSKNILLVGAVKDITDQNIEITSFSSWGPTDDGRIKPDICGNGWKLKSSSSYADDSYETFSGTSMASPNVAGSLLLLQQLYREQYDQFMRASTLKALAIHTATDDNQLAGPDYQYGWGVLNTQKAADVIINNNEASFIEELTLADKQEFIQHVKSDGVSPLIATICWTDPAAEVGVTGKIDDRTPRLVNDLDIRIIQDDNVYKPWTLDPANPGALAIPGDNIRDNVEQVMITAPKGNYTIKVTHKGNLKNSIQDFALIISNVETTPCTAATVPQNISVSNIKATSARVLWDFADPMLSYEVRYRLTDETHWTHLQNIVNAGFQFTNLIPNNQYVFQVRSLCNGTPSDYSDEVFFDTHDCVTPSEIIPTSVSTNYIKVKWDRVNEAMSYTVTYKKESDTHWKELQTTDTAIKIDNLTSGTVYDIRLRADCSIDYYSDEIFIKQTTDCLPVTNANVEWVTNSEALIKWEKIEGIERYEARYKEIDTNEWSTVSFADNEALLTNLIPGGYYNFQLRSICANGEELYHSVSLHFRTYCDVAASNSDNEWIDFVTIGAISNGSGNSNGYGDFRDMVTNVKPGSGVSIGLQSGQVSDFPKYWRIWADFNRDGDFDDENELAGEGISASNGIYETTINIPEDALPGNTLLRIAMRYNSYPDVCASFEYGEIEDYSINIGSKLDQSSFTAKKELQSATLLSKADIDIYPVPVSTILHVNLGENIPNGGILTIFDVTGKALREVKINQRTTINIEGFNSGYYLIRYKKGKTTITKRFLKL
ncbi:T9SS type A sorting domain-containing protein [Puteibacter caeruleilacunae]|nr:T9SS type A sorting domain-containing protein [Puteibacter caeruleilacunae]